jgi:quercetin dioxygenase-like cupin family protein
MSTEQAGAGEIIGVGPLGAALAGTATTKLVKTPALDVVRLIVPAGREIPEHRAPGLITVHCLEGAVDFTTGGQTRRLDAGQLLYLTAGTPHALRGVEDASLLVTIFRG